MKQSSNCIQYIIVYVLEKLRTYIKLRIKNVCPLVVHRRVSTLALPYDLQICIKVLRLKVLKTYVKQIISIKTENKLWVCIHKYRIDDVHVAGIQSFEPQCSN